MKLAPVFDGVSLAEACDYPFRSGLIAQEKIDGVRAWLDCDTGQLTGRNTPQGCLGSTLPAGCVLDGELVKGAYHAFDLLKLNGQDVTGEPLRWRLEQLAKLTAKHAALLPVEQSNDPQALARRVNQRGGEGIVVKLANSSYQRGRWTRCKREFTAEFTIIQADAGKLSAEVSRDGKSVGRIFGFTESEIQSARAGQVVEVRAIQFTSAGKLRSGRFLRFRGDKITA